MIKKIFICWKCFCCYKQILESGEVAVQPKMENKVVKKDNPAKFYVEPTENLQ